MVVVGELILVTWHLSICSYKNALYETTMYTLLSSYIYHIHLVLQVLFKNLDLDLEDVTPTSFRKAGRASGRKPLFYHKKCWHASTTNGW